MPANVVVPEVGESIVDARVAKWLKKEGDVVNVGDPLVELETDKIDLEVAAPQGGVLSRIAHRDGRAYSSRLHRPRDLALRAAHREFPRSLRAQEGEGEQLRGVLARVRYPENIHFKAHEFRRCFRHEQIEKCPFLALLQWTKFVAMRMIRKRDARFFEGPSHRFHCDSDRPSLFQLSAR